MLGKTQGLQETGQMGSSQIINVDTHAIQCAEVGKAVDAGNISEGWRRAQQLTYKQICYEKVCLSHKGNPDKHSQEAVVFKTSREMAEIAV